MPSTRSNFLIGELIAKADAIEISQDHKRIALYQWRDQRRSWVEDRGPGFAKDRTGVTLYALLELAVTTGLEIAAWRDGERML